MRTKGALVVPPHFAAAHQSGSNLTGLLTVASRRGLLSSGRSAPRSGGSSQGLEAAIPASAALWTPANPATRLHRHFLLTAYQTRRRRPIGYPISGGAPGDVQDTPDQPCSMRRLTATGNATRC